MDETKKQSIIRMAPCSSYEPERMASWLEFMAQRNFLKRLHPKLPEYNQDWRNGALRYGITTILCMVSYCFIFGFVFLLFLYSI